MGCRNGLETYSDSGTLRWGRDDMRGWDRVGLGRYARFGRVLKILLSGVSDIIVYSKDFCGL